MIIIMIKLSFNGSCFIGFIILIHTMEQTNIYATLTIQSEQLYNNYSGQIWKGPKRDVRRRRVEWWGLISVESLLHEGVEVSEGCSEAALEGLPLEEEGADVEEQLVDGGALLEALLARDVHAERPHGGGHVGADHGREVAHDQPQRVAAALHVSFIFTL